MTYLNNLPMLVPALLVLALRASIQIPPCWADVGFALGVVASGAMYGFAVGYDVACGDQLQEVKRAAQEDREEREAHDRFWESN